MLIATLTDHRADQVEAAARTAAGADLLELRLDLLDEAERQGAAEILPRLPAPAMVTCRRPQDGGTFRDGEDDRLALLRRFLAAGAAWADVEEGSAAEVLLAEFPAVRFMLSRHLPAGAADEAAAATARLARHAGAAAGKVVLAAGGPADNLVARDLLARSGGPVPLAVFCSGQAGVPSRLLALAWGSAATYGYAGARPAAPGQVAVREMDAVYGVRRLTAATEVVGILGQPLAHSLTPRCHNAAYRHLGIDMVLLPLECDRPEGALDLVRRMPMRGLAVTAPHKRAVRSLLDQEEPLAARVGAVNTVLRDGGRLVGLNTDVAGGLAPLERRLPLVGCPVALLGAGGAARALAHGLAEAGARVTIFARRPEAARGLALEAGVEHRPWEDLAGHPHRVLVNATPVGAYPGQPRSPVPASWLRAEWVYDIVYNPRRTLLLRHAQERGLGIIEGLEMFLGQAEAQFLLLTDREAPRGVMRHRAEAALAAPGRADG